MKMLNFSVIEAQNGGLCLMMLAPDKPASQVPQIWTFKNPEDIGIHVSAMVAAAVSEVPR